MTTGTIVLLTLLLQGQLVDSKDPYARRHNMELIVNHFGPVSRGFVEAYRELAVAALARCDLESGQRLCALHNGGKLEAMQRPKAVLTCVAQPNHGGVVASWLCLHADELIADQSALEAFLKPGQALELSLGLKTIDEARAAPARKIPLPDIDPNEWYADSKVWAGAAAAVLVAVLAHWAWRNRTSSPYNP